MLNIMVTVPTSELLALVVLVLVGVISILVSRMRAPFFLARNRDFFKCDPESNASIIYSEIGVIIAAFVAGILFFLKIISAPLLGVAVLFFMICLFYLIALGNRQFIELWSDVARDYGSQMSKTFMTVFGGREYSFEYKSHLMKVSLYPPYKVQVISLSDYAGRRRGQNNAIYFYVSHSCQKDLKVDIPLEGFSRIKEAKDTSDKSDLKSEAAIAVLNLGEGKVYLRKGFLVYRVTMPIIISKSFLKKKAEDLFNLAEALG
jgi:hypothetical protein